MVDLAIPVYWIGLGVIRMSERSYAHARELASRAICKARKLPETVTIDGAPLWDRFLPEADAVLEAIGWVTDEAEEDRETA